MSSESEDRACFGVYYDAQVQDCQNCSIGGRCSSAYKNRNGKKTPANPEEPIPSTTDRDEDTTPFEHFISSLEKRFDREDRAGDTTDGIFFGENDKTCIQIITSKTTERIKILSHSFERVLDSEDSIESIEEAEEILNIILGQ